MQRYLYWKVEQHQRKWQRIPDTPEAKGEALQAGAMFFTWTTFSDNGTQEPTRCGNLVFDFDDKADPGEALREMKELCLVHLPELYDLDPHSIRFYASGKKGFHAEIPAKVFNAQDGDPYLPLIYKRIVADWMGRFNLTTIDTSMYAMQRGKMYRLPNVKRSNGRYKVPLTLDEVMSRSMDELLEFTKSRREIASPDTEIVEVEELSRLYRTTRAAVHHELEENQEAPELSEEERQRLAKNLPPCLAHIITEMPNRSEKINFNKLIMLLVTYFQLAGWRKNKVWAKVARFVREYPPSDTYDTEDKRIAHWKSQWTYLQNNLNYSFSCHFVKGLSLPGYAFECKDCLTQREKEKLTYGQTILPAAEFVKLEIPPRESLLHPIIKESSITEIYGPRGVGKTMLAQGITEAIAYNTGFAPWEAGKQVRCLYLEGEMPALIAPKRLPPSLHYFKSKPWQAVRPGIGYPIMQYHPNPLVADWFIRRFGKNSLTPFLYLRRRGPWLYRL